MIEIQLKLINFAMKKNRYDRFVLISDDTVVVRNKKVTISYIKENCDRYDARLISPGDEFYQRYYNFFYVDHPVTALRRGRDMRDVFIDGEFLRNFVLLKNYLDTLGKKPIDLYYGSQWWVLTEESIKFFLAEINSDKHLLNSFRFSMVPDEMMFQTIVENMHRKKSASLRYKRKRAGCPVYVDWSRKIKPFIFENIEQFPHSFNDYIIFIRKIDNNAESLLKEIDTKFS